MNNRPKLGVIQSHPIQYFSPLYRELAKDTRIRFKALYCSAQGAETYRDEGFQRSIKWDTPLLEGHESQILPNLGGDKGVGGFFSLINLGLIKELRTGGYDAMVVNGHNYFSYVLGLLLCKLFGIKAYMRCETHARLERHSLKRLFRRFFLRGLFTQVCHGGLAIGTRNAEFYAANGMPNERIILAPYSVDNDFFREKSALSPAALSQLKKKHGIPDDLFLILFASKLSERKGCADLLEAYISLKAENPKAGLVIVGTGELEQTLRTRAASTRDVFFLGFKNQTEMPEMFGMSDVFVLPSRNEPWGLIINEAMACGLPIVASAEIGAVTDLVRSGENGLLFEAGNVPELTANLKTMAADPARRRTMGAKSLDIIGRWGLRETALGFARAALKAAEGQA